MASSPIALENPALPSGSTILVTGVNGLLASHIADQLLLAKYNVRGTVRSIEKNAWMEGFFSKRYTSNSVKFELVQVANMEADGCFDDAVKGCDGVIHTTSSIEINAAQPEPAIPKAVKTVMTCMESASKADSVKRFVLTSSAWTVSAPKPDVKFTVSARDWNEEAIKAAYAEPPPPFNGMNIFMAGKSLAEKECFKFVKEKNPSFVFNAVLPDTVFGNILSPENQGIPSTAGLVRMLFEGQGLEMLNFIQPQQYIDAGDNARLHVAVLLDPKTNNERLLGCAGPWNWNDILSIFRTTFPDREFVQDMELGRDVSVVENERSLELLKEVYGQQGWTGLEQSVRMNVDSFVTGKASSKRGLLDNI